MATSIIISFLLSPSFFSDLLTFSPSFFSDLLTFSPSHLLSFPTSEFIYINP
ncbi:hypothetical protein D1AOALGA4SA_9389 [Olavius algarvensis Delta 1 endosymbiont]|nr:hypothetical protein D1AOALGA4SA_9389 [Olavius algarvensis Delta 1 endosymbiont]